MLSTSPQIGAASSAQAPGAPVDPLLGKTVYLEVPKIQGAKFIGTYNGTCTVDSVVDPSTYTVTFTKAGGAKIALKVLKSRALKCTKRAQKPVALKCTKSAPTGRRL